MIKHIESKEELLEILKEGDTLVDFFATWCGPCRMVAPILEEIDKENHPFQIVKIDTDEATELAIEFGIQSIPTLLFFREGQEIRKRLGFARKDEILELCK